MHRLPEPKLHPRTARSKLSFLLSITKSNVGDRVPPRRRGWITCQTRPRKPHMKQQKDNAVLRTIHGFHACRSLQASDLQPCPPWPQLRHITYSVKPSFKESHSGERLDMSG